MAPLFNTLLNKLGNEAYKNDRNFDNIINFYNAKDRCLFLDEIEEGTGSAISAMIYFYNRVDDEENIPVEERKPIKIYINSPGGMLTETFIMVDAIKMSKTPVWGVVTGIAYSGGFFTLLACHKRIAYPHASFLYHEGATSTGGTAAQFQNYAEFYKKELELLKDIVIEHTNITEEEYKDMKKDDVLFTTKEALEKNIIDEIAVELI